MESTCGGMQQQINSFLAGIVPATVELGKEALPTLSR